VADDLSFCSSHDSARRYRRGGFPGTHLAINLHRHGGPGATLIERGAAAGEGLAFGAAHRNHVLNVRAPNMSAFPDDQNPS